MKSTKTRNDQKRKDLLTKFKSFRKNRIKKDQFLCDIFKGTSMERLNPEE